MSILQDLDPKYAKIHKQPTSPWPKLASASLILIGAGCAYWLFISASIPGTSAQNAPLATTSKANSQDAGEKASAASISADGDTRPALGSATINEAVVRRDNTPLAIPEKDADLAKISESQSEAITQLGSPLPLAVEYKTAVPASKHAAIKSEHHKTKVQAPSKSDNKQVVAQPVGSKHASERDVEIISAIVR